MERNEQVRSFVVEWFDPHPQLLKKYLLKYFCESNEVEMKDLQTSRKFLKRTKVPSSVSQSDFFVGGNILLFSRDLKIIDYGDNSTRTQLETASEKTVLVLAPALFNLVGEIIRDIEDSGFTLVDLRAFRLSDSEREDADRLLGMRRSISLERGICVAVAFRGIRSVKQINDKLSMSSMTGIICASCTAEAEAFESFFFAPRPTTALLTNCTCCVIKPHAIKARKCGAILDTIISLGYEITAMQLFHLGRGSAQEFLEVYDGIVKDYHHRVDELCSGPVIALELRTGGDEPVASFRTSAGPWDVDMAKELYPNSIRAKFGENVVQNAIHCTDLPRDGENEVQFFFDILAEAS